MLNNFPYPEQFVIDDSYSPLFGFNSPSDSNYTENQIEGRSLSSFQSPQPSEISNDEHNRNMESGEKENNDENKENKINFKNFQNDNGLTINKNLFREDHLNELKADENMGKNGNNNSENSNNSTNSTLTQKKLSTKIERLIQTFKKNFSNYLKIQINNLIQESLLPENLKKINIKVPNSKDFTSIAAIKDNYRFLSYTVLKILSYYTDKNQKNKYQKKNEIDLRKILDYIEICENSKKFEKISSFLEMTLENAYIKFYESGIFFKFANDDETLERDKVFKKIYRFSLLEKYGFLKLIKKYYKGDQ